MTDSNESKFLPLTIKLTHPDSGETIHYSGELTQKHLDAAVRLSAKKDDIFICSYPKSGTTWLQHIVWLITHNGKSYFEGMGQDQCIPFIDLTEPGLAEKVDTRGHQRIFKTHLPFGWIPYNKDAKYLYITRDPKDVLVSWPNHYKFQGYRRFNPSDCQLDHIYDMFMRDEMLYGEQCQHTAEYYERRNQPNVLFLVYKNLKADLEGEIVKIAKFLGRDYLDKIQKNEGELLKQIVKDSTFEAMSKLSNLIWVSFVIYQHTVNKKITSI